MIAVGRIKRENAVSRVALGNKHGVPNNVKVELNYLIGGSIYGFRGKLLPRFDHLSGKRKLATSKWDN